MAQGAKDDDGKTRFDLVPSCFVALFRCTGDGSPPPEGHARVGLTSLRHIEMWRKNGKALHLRKAALLASWPYGRHAITLVAEVLTYGAFLRPRPDGSKGYGANNWQDVPDAKGRYYSAAMRHATKSLTSPRDAESGLLHLAHYLTNLAFLLSFEVGHDKPLDAPANKPLL